MTGPMWIFLSLVPSRSGDHGFCLTVLEKIIALILASLAISRFVSNVSRNAKLLDALSRHLAGQNRVHVAKLRPRVVSWNVTCVFAI